MPLHPGRTSWAIPKAQLWMVNLWKYTRNLVATITAGFGQCFPLTAGALLGPAFNRLEGFQVGLGSSATYHWPDIHLLERLCPNLRHLILRRPTSTALQITDADVLACQTWQTCAPLLASGQISITNVGNPTMAIFFAVPVAMGNRNN